MEKTGGNGGFLLLEMTGSTGAEVVELVKKVLELELPLLLPLDRLLN